MPERNVIDIILAKRVLSKKDWLLMLEQRRRALYPHLSRISLPRLDTIVFMQGDLQTPLSISSFEFERPEVKEHGAFSPVMRDVTALIWGLTRDGFWAACSFKMCIRVSRGMSERAINETTFAFEKGLTTLQLNRAYQIPFRKMWDLMGEVVRQCAQYRREQLEAIERLGTRFAMEDIVVDACRTP